MDAETQARKLARTGAIELGVGVAAMSGGIVVMLVGRGEPGEISNESQRTSDLKSAGGAALVIGGFTAALVGGNTLGKARALRERAAVTVIPLVCPPHPVGAASPDRCGGVLLTASF